MIKKLFNGVFQVDHMESKVLFQPILFQNVEEKCQPLLLSPPATDSNSLQNIQLLMVKYSVQL